MLDDRPREAQQAVRVRLPCDVKPRTAVRLLEAVVDGKPCRPVECAQRKPLRRLVGGDLELCLRVVAKQAAPLGDPPPPRERPSACDSTALACHSGNFSTSVRYANTSATGRPISIENSTLTTARVYLYSTAGPVAQLVEQGTFNPKVAGSNPARPIEESPANQHFCRCATTRQSDRPTA